MEKLKYELNPIASDKFFEMNTCRGGTDYDQTDYDSVLTVRSSVKSGMDKPNDSGFLSLRPILKGK